jgi:hypothetical protein
MWIKSFFDPLYRWLTDYMGACGFILYGGGKGGSSAPPPDPALIAAQIRSLDTQGEAIRQVMENSGRLLPMQEEAMRFGLDTSKTAYNQSQQDREWMLGRRGALSGLQDRLVSDANVDPRALGDQYATENIASLNAGLSRMTDSQNRNYDRRGVNINSASRAALDAQTKVMAAAQAAGLASAGRQRGKQESYALTDRATNALAGYPAMAANMTGQGAGFGGLGLDTANKGLAGMNSGFGAGSQMAGQMGQNATSMWNAQANYKVNADKQAADSDPFATILGAGTQIASAGIGAGWFSDRRLKTDIVLVGVDEATGLNLYEFRYIDGDKRFRGVMADEVEVNYPQAVYTMPDGYKAVNYALLGIDMVLVEGETV